MWVRNTSGYPDDEVRELVEYACEGMPMTRVCVNVKRQGPRRRSFGRAYNGVPGPSNAPPTAEYLVTVALPDEFDGVTFNAERRGSRWPVYRTHDWRELLVVVAAHEAKHVEQFRDGRPLSEVACEHWARHRLSRYRTRGLREAAV